MGRRSDFPRRPMDSYETPANAVIPLMPFIEGLSTFAEPCAGRGKLVAALEAKGLRCSYQGDILYGEDALATTDYGDCDVIITNPPWTRPILHPLILHFQKIAPTWLIFDADWMHNVQAAPFLDQCSHIVAIGRLKWMAKSDNTGKDNVAWYRFDHRHSGGPKFYGRKPKPVAQPIKRIAPPVRQKVTYA